MVATRTHTNAIQGLAQPKSTGRTARLKIKTGRSSWSLNFELFGRWSLNFNLKLAIKKTLTLVLLIWDGYGPLPVLGRARSPDDLVGILVLSLNCICVCFLGYPVVQSTSVVRCHLCGLLHICCCFVLDDHCTRLSGASKLSVKPQAALSALSNLRSR